MQLRVFTKSGNEMFASWIDKAKLDPSLNPPLEILEDDKYSKVLEPTIDVELIEASTRLEVGIELRKQLASVSEKEKLHNAKLWSWLSLFNIDLLAPVEKGKRAVAAANRLIFDPEDFSCYYRHLLRGAWDLVKQHKADPDICRCVLSSAPHIGSEMYEQVGSRKRFRFSSAVLHAVNSLYYDDENKMQKRGATNYNKPGTIRRLLLHCEQFRETYNLNEADPDAFFDLLPKEEYSRWQQS